MKSHNLLWQVYFTGGRTDFPGQFDGDSCKHFLNLVENLEVCLKDLEGAYETVAPVISAIKISNEVRKQCFTVDLDPRYKNTIREFAHQMLRCDRSIRLKCHCVFVHIVQFLEAQEEKFPNKGLGFWAEQAIEGSHHKFDKEYEGFKRLLAHPQFEEKLFDCGLIHNKRAYGDQRNK